MPATAPRAEAVAQRPLRAPDRADRASRDGADAVERDEHAEEADVAVGVAHDQRARAPTRSRMTHISTTLKALIVTHTQGRDDDLAEASAQFLEDALAARPLCSRPRARGRTGSSVTALTRNVAASSANASPAPTVRTSSRGQRRAEHQREVPGALGQRPRRLDLVLGNGLRQQPGVGGLEERPRGAERSPRSRRSATRARCPRGSAPRASRAPRRERGRWRSSPGGAAGGRPRRRRTAPAATSGTVCAARISPRSVAEPVVRVM